MSDKDSIFELVFEGPVSDDAETLRKLKGVMIADLQFSVDQVMEFLSNTPITIKRADNESELQLYYDLLTAAGGKVLLVQPYENDNGDATATQASEDPIVALDLDAVSPPAEEVVEEESASDWNLSLGEQLDEEAAPDEPSEDVVLQPEESESQPYEASEESYDAPAPEADDESEEGDKEYQAETEYTEDAPSEYVAASESEETGIEESEPVEEIVGSAAEEVVVEAAAEEEISESATDEVVEAAAQEEVVKEIAADTPAPFELGELNEDSINAMVEQVGEIAEAAAPEATTESAASLFEMDDGAEAAVNEESAEESPAEELPPSPVEAMLSAFALDDDAGEVEAATEESADENTESEAPAAGENVFGADSGFAMEDDSSEAEQPQVTTAAAADTGESAVDAEDAEEVASRPLVGLKRRKPKAEREAAVVSKKVEEGEDAESEDGGESEESEASSESIEAPEKKRSILSSLPLDIIIPIVIGATVLGVLNYAIFKF